MRLSRQAAAGFLVLVWYIPVSGSAQQGKPSTTPPQNMVAVIDMMRSDVTAQKKGVVTSVMRFSESEAKAFWPIYQELEAELAAMGDRRVAVIKDYVENIDNLSDEKADTLVRKTVELEKSRIDLKERYYGKFKKVLTPVRAAKFMQLENQLLMMMDLQIASNLPFIR